MRKTSTELTQYQHGGNLSWVREHYPYAPTPLMDLSTCINPYGYPLPALESHWNYELPDVTDMANAHKAVAQFLGLKDEVNVALGSGMQPLMVALASLRLARYGKAHVAVLPPTYVEHERVWGQLGHECFACDELKNIKADVVIICNPNNPDARRYTVAELKQLADTLARQDGWLIIDESFGDLEPQASMVGEVHYHNNLIVMRSFGKFFGVAGLRVSTAVADRKLIEALRTLSGPWPISTTACHQLPRMLKDTVWVKDMRERLHTEAQQWRGVLKNYFTIVGHTPLFTLVDMPDAKTCFERLAAQGILVRKFECNPRWLRVGLPDEAQVSRLLNAFEECFVS